MANYNLYKHPKYGHVYGEAIVTPNARCCWLWLIKPQPSMKVEGKEPSPPRYGVTLLLDKADKEVTAWVKAVSNMAAAMCDMFNEGKNAKLTIEGVAADGDSQDTEKYPFCKGMYIISPKNVDFAAISLADNKKNLVLATDFLGGMIVKAVVTPLVTAHGVSYKLNVLQKVKDDGVRFGGANRAGSYLDTIPGTPEETTGESGENANTEDDKPAILEQQVLALKNPTVTAKSGKAKALAML